jgi:hypothetical protein
VAVPHRRPKLGGSQPRFSAGGNTSRIGKQWTNDFIRCNPDIKSKIQKRLSATRAKYTTKGVIINYFELSPYSEAVVPNGLL